MGPDNSVLSSQGGWSGALAGKRWCGVSTAMTDVGDGVFPGLTVMGLVQLRAVRLKEGLARQLVGAGSRTELGLTEGVLHADVLEPVKELPGVVRDER